jgi:hypothetical protein
MAKNINYSCDGCYKVLFGKEKSQFVKKPHLQFNGQIVEQMIDKETGWQSHTFITPSQNEKLCFCLETWQECLGQYIKTRKFLWEQRREEVLKGQAGREHEDRLLR